MYWQLLWYFLILLTIGWGWYALYLKKSALQEATLKKVYLNFAFIAYACALVALTIIPSQRFSLNTSIALVNYKPLVHTWQRYVMVTYFENHQGIRNFYQNLIGNVLLFMPLGAFLWLRFKKSAGSVILIAFATSCFIEITQFMARFIGYYRHIDIDDVLLNTAGALLGYACIRLIVKRHPATNRSIS